MAINLSSNPTCVLSDADNLTAEQRQKINMNLTKGIPGSDIEGDKVTVINSEGEVEMKAYSAGGGGSSYTAGNGISISNDTISAKIDGTSITVNSSGELQAAGGSEALFEGVESPLHIYEDPDDEVKKLQLIYDSDSLMDVMGQLKVQAAPYYLDYNPDYMYVPDLVEFKRIIEEHRPVYLRIESEGSESGKGLYIPAIKAEWTYDQGKNEWNVSFLFQTHKIEEWDLYTRRVTTETWSVSRDQSTRGGESVPTHTTTYSYMINPESYVAYCRALEIPSWDKDGADIGKVLKINSDNELEWVTP